MSLESPIKSNSVGRFPQIITNKSKIPGYVSMFQSSRKALKNHLYTHYPYLRKPPVTISATLIISIQTVICYNTSNNQLLHFHTISPVFPPARVPPSCQFCVPASFKSVICFLNTSSPYLYSPSN